MVDYAMGLSSELREQCWLVGYVGWLDMLVGLE